MRCRVYRDNPVMALTLVQTDHCVSDRIVYAQVMADADVGAWATGLLRRVPSSVDFLAQLVRFRGRLFR
jgi:hypothetical protein